MCPCAQCAHRCAPAQVCVCAAVLASEGPGGGSGQRSEGTGTSVPLDSSCSCLAVSPDRGVRSGPSRGRWVRCAAEAEGPSARVCCLLQRPGQLMEGPQRADRSQHSVTSASPGPARGRLPRLQWGSVCLPRFWSKASGRGPCGVAVRGGHAGWLCGVAVRGDRQCRVAVWGDHVGWPYGMTGALRPPCREPEPARPCACGPRAGVSGAQASSVPTAPGVFGRGALSPRPCRVAGPRDLTVAGGHVLTRVRAPPGRSPFSSSSPRFCPSPLQAFPASEARP